MDQGFLSVFGKSEADDSYGCKVMTRIRKLANIIAMAASAIAVLGIGAASGVFVRRASAAPPADAQQVYLDKCAVCHAKDGSGNTAKGKKVKAKDLRSAEVQRMSDAELLDAVAKGKGKDMDGFQKELGADMVKQLVTYCRSLAGK
jgi:mono/diheme cytochrome c family protein